MLEPMTAVLVGFIVGGGAGAFSAYLGWNRSGEDFDKRKFIDGLATGVIAGLLLVFANLMAFKELTDDFAVLALIGTIFIGALGADNARESVSGAVVSKRGKTVSVTKTDSGAVS